MSSSADISGLVASWVGVGIAVIGVLGIAPILLLVESRSKTNRALRTIEDRGNGFIGAGVPWFNGNRLFRSVKAPDFSDPPKFKDDSGVASDSKAGLKSATTAAQEVSTTGWVNLASLLLKFDTSLHLKRENCLVINDLQTWLPVHRLWLLVLGLQGRYGIREDMGKAYLRQPETDYEYREESVSLESRKVLSGTTGVLETDLNDVEEGFQKVYFGLHSPQVRGDFTGIGESRVRLADQISLSTLFWLSFGFLPGKPGKNGQRIYHLGGYVSPAARRLRAFSMDGSYENISLSYEFKPKNLGGSQILWGEAIGVHKAPQVLHLVAREKDNIVAERWDPPGGTQESDWLSLGRKEHYISKPDVHRLILTLMTLELSPLGFMAPKSSQHFINLLFHRCSKRFFVLLDWAQQMGIFDDKQTKSDMYKNFELAKTSTEPWRFSRRLSESLYDLHKMIQELEPAKPPTRLQNTVAILTITDKQFRAMLKPESNVVQLVDAIRRARATWPPDETSLFGNLGEGERDGFSDEITIRDIVLPALRAATVCAWFTRSLDSTPLIKFVDCMGSVVLVAAKARAPYCPPTSLTTRSQVDTRSDDDDIRREGVSRRERTERRTADRSWDSSSPERFSYVRPEDVHYPDIPSHRGWERGATNFRRHEDIRHGDWEDRHYDEYLRSRDRSRERKDKEDRNRDATGGNVPRVSQEMVPLGAMAGTRRPAPNAREERQPKQVNFGNDRLPRRHRHDAYSSGERTPEPPREPRSEIDPDDRNRETRWIRIVERPVFVGRYDGEKSESSDRLW